MGYQKAYKLSPSKAGEVKGVALFQVLKEEAWIKASTFSLQPCQHP